MGRLDQLHVRLHLLVFGVDGELLLLGQLHTLNLLTLCGELIEMRIEETRTADVDRLALFLARGAAQPDASVKADEDHHVVCWMRRLTDTAEGAESGAFVVDASSV